MFGVLFFALFFAVALAFACTEFLLVWLDARQRVIVGSGRPLLIILGANVASFAIVWTSAMTIVSASRSELHLEATVVCLAAQAVWLAQTLWLYYRDHLRLRYEN